MITENEWTDNEFKKAITVDINVNIESVRSGRQVYK